MIITLHWVLRVCVYVLHNQALYELSTTVAYKFKNHFFKMKGDIGIVGAPQRKEQGVVTQ